MDMTSLAPVLFNLATNEGKSIFFMGSKESEIGQFIDVLKVKFPDVPVKGFRSGYFVSEEEYHTCLEELAAEKPDILVCGMGTPKQEQVLIDLKSKGWDGMGITCGGFIHQTASSFDYYPRLFQKLNIRWVYRIIDEPKLFRRYFIDYPLAFLIIMKDIIREE